MANLTGRTPASSYQELLTLRDGILGPAPMLVVDGQGHESTLQLSTTTVAINGLAFPTTGMGVGKSLTIKDDATLEWTTVVSAADHIATTNIHVTPQQSTLLNALVVGAPQINTLAGVNGNVQDQLDALVIDSVNQNNLIQNTVTNYQAADQTIRNTVGVLRSDFDAYAALPHGATTIQITGDASALWVTSSGNESTANLALTLATVNANQSTFNFGTVDIKGRVTNVSTKPYWDTSVDITSSARLSLTLTPTLPNHAVNKKYVDDQISTGLPAVGTAGSYVRVTTDAQGRVLSGASTISVSGDVVGTIQATGSTVLNLATMGSAGTFRSVTIDTKGRVTGGTNPTTLAGYAITDALPIVGGTLTGPLYLVNADPVGDTAATTKKYVDDSIADAVIEASAGTLIYHQNLQELQGGSTTERYHLTLAEHDKAQAMATTWTANGSRFVLASHQTVLDAFSGKTGLVMANNGVPSIAFDPQLTSDLKFGLGSVTYVDPNGQGGPNYTFRKAEAGFRVNDGALVLNGYNVVDPYAFSATFNTYPKLVFRQNSTDGPTLTAQGSTLFLNNTVALNTSAAITAGSFTTSSSVTAGSAALNTLTVSGVSALGAGATVSGTPSANNHIVHKQYVDSTINSAVAGSDTAGYVANLPWKYPVKVASTSAITNLTGLLIIDSIQLVEGDRVLVKNQNGSAAHVNNGVWVAHSGAWARDPVTLTNGSIFYVSQGTANATQAFSLTTVGALVVGTTPIQFTSFNNSQVVVLTGDASGSGTTSINVTLNPSGVSAGTYSQVTVNAKGQVTAGGNPTTLAAYGITDGISKSGGTMGGFLELVGAPLIDLHAATKKYVDDKTSGPGVTAGNGLTLNGNDLNINATSATRIVVNANDIDLATTGVTAGTYNNVTVDAYGRVTAASTVGNSTITLSGDITGSGTSGITTALSTTGVVAGTYKQVTVDVKGRVSGGTNPTTLSGYGITDAVAKAGSTMTGALILGTSDTVSTANNAIQRVKDPVNPQDVATKNYVDTATGSAVQAGNGLAFTGSVLNIVPISATRLAVTSGKIDLATSGVTAGTYSSVTVDAYGRVTAATNPTPANQPITLTGDAAGTGASSITVTLANTGVTAGSYTKFTVNSKGLVTTASNPTTFAGLGLADSIGSLNDVTIASPTTNQVLSYNGTRWINVSQTQAVDKYVGNSASDSTPGYLTDKLEFGTSFANSIIYPNSDERTRIELATPIGLLGGATYGYQQVNVGGSVTGSTGTGLLTDGTTYISTITINGTLKTVTVVGTNVTTYRKLIAAINSVIYPIGQATITGGNIRITSSAAGAASTVSISDGPTEIFRNLTLFNTVSAAVNGTSSGPFNTVDIDIYGRVIAANNTSGSNQPITVSGDATAYGSTTLALTLASTGVVAGTYTSHKSSITVDAKGRVTAASNFAQPTTLSGYGITDAQPLSTYLTGLSSLTTGLTVRTSSNTAVSRTLAVVNTTRLTITNANGDGGNPTFDLASGVIPTPGIYTKLTVDTYGRVISGTTATISDVTGAGTMASQNANTVNITGGIVANVVLVPRVITLTWSANLVLNWANADIIRVVLAGNTVITNTNGFDGQKCLLELIQDSTGNRTVAFSSETRFGTDITGFTPSTIGNKKDRLGMIYDGPNSSFDMIAVVRGF